METSIKIAFKYVWIVNSTVLLIVIIILPWLPAIFAAIVPVCPSKLQGNTCVFCGGTRALQFLLNGQVANSFRQNPLTILLIICICINSCLFLHYIFKQRKKV